jgi:two-component system phosphate regulon sensor histidine kinase PhoR
MTAVHLVGRYCGAVLDDSDAISFKLAVSGPDVLVLANRLTMVFSVFAVFAAALFLVILYGGYRQRAEFLKDSELFLKVIRRGEPLSTNTFIYMRRVVDSFGQWQAASQNKIAASRAIIDSIPDAVLVVAHDGRVIYLNTEAETLFGGSIEIQDAPAGDKEIRSRVCSQWLMEMLNDVGMDNKGTTNSVRLIDVHLDSAGNQYLRLRVSPYYSGYDARLGSVGVSGDVLARISARVSAATQAGVIILAHDISDVKRLQAVRDDFIANVSHEIRTPVTAIVGFAETLLGGALEDADNAVKFIRIIAIHAERLNRLVDALTTISDLERGFTRLNKSAVDFSSVADSVIEILKSKAVEKGLRLNALYQEQCIIEADADGLFQILINLVDNAIKFTISGEISIGICGGLDGGVYSIFVSDTGIGVSSEHVARLGERFFRVDVSRARNLGGTGLGLAIVKHIVMAHRWEMSFESKKGGGSIVRIVTSNG